jgi:hypothetical protein
MGEKPERDVEKVYSTSEFVAKLRRLADALETGERFEIQVAGERVYVHASSGSDPRRTQTARGDRHSRGRRAPERCVAERTRLPSLD